MKKIFFLIILVLYGCTSSGSAINSITKETIPEPLIYFCPEDNCENLLSEYIKNSQKSIHCALYDMDLDNLSILFSEKSKNIDVKIVMDSDNQNKMLSGKGIVYDTKNQLMHNKFCIFDNKIVWTGSFNPTKSEAYANNNNVIVISSKKLVNNYELEFNELWNYNFGKGHKTLEPVIYLNNKKYENWFCPDDNCQQHVLDELKKAEESIYFMTFSFTDQDIAELLISKKQAGKEVKGVGEGSRFTMQYEQYNDLISAGVDVRKDKNPKTMHNKVFIIDQQTVITGSYNPTKAADEKNDENILIINDKDIADKYLKEFYFLFN